MNDDSVLSCEERKKRLREIQLSTKRKIIKHPDFEIAWPELVTWLGFILILALCILIILATGWIGKLLVK